MAVKAEYINPFLVSAVSVLNDMTGEKPKKDKVVIQKVNFKSQGFTVIVGITEGGRGRILLDMKRETAIKMSEIINEEKYNGLEDFVFITCAEVGNMISGNGITQINNKNKGLNLRLTPPSIFSGENLEVNSPKLSSVGIAFDLSFGKISLNIAFEEGGEV